MTTYEFPWKESGPGPYDSDAEGRLNNGEATMNRREIKVAVDALWAAGHVSEANIARTYLLALLFPDEKTVVTTAGLEKLINEIDHCPGNEEAKCPAEKGTLAECRECWLRWSGMDNKRTPGHEPDTEETP